MYLSLSLYHHHYLLYSISCHLHCRLFICSYFFYVFFLCTIKIRSFSSNICGVCSFCILDTSFFVKILSLLFLCLPVYFQLIFFIFCIILHLSTSFCDSAAVISKFPTGLESMKSYFVISYKSEVLDSYHLPTKIWQQSPASQQMHYTVSNF